MEAHRPINRGPLPRRPGPPSAAGHPRHPGSPSARPTMSLRRRKEAAATSVTSDLTLHSRSRHTAASYRLVASVEAVPAGPRDPPGFGELCRRWCPLSADLNLAVGVVWGEERTRHPPGGRRSRKVKLVAGAGLLRVQWRRTVISVFETRTKNKTKQSDDAVRQNPPNINQLTQNIS